ncbi:hypothetical protein [Chryseobacterium lathyri]|uniref:hypothetical protein n=1 Tax=Chryseobacterium lathyri TaxID=395933 RepID=UPI001CBEB9D8|nr:hypothetical protein [Chryseobacterium lathyri]
MSEIKDVLDALTVSIKKEQIELYKQIIQTNKITSFDGPEEFFFAVIYPFEKFVSGMINCSVSKNPDIEFIYENYNFVERMFLRLVKEKEGFSCSADKSRTIIRSLIKFFETNTEISFNYDGEYTYHLPKKIFSNHKEIINFYEAIKKLYCGNPDKYVEFISELK